MKRKILNLVLVLLFVTTILMPTSNNIAVADELGYASEQQQERGAFDILKTSVDVAMGASASALATTPPSGTFITWNVTNDKIATVSLNGIVTGVRIGTTQLNATISIPGLTTMTKTTTINVTPDTFLFYIKNKNSGQYLVADRATANVIQDKHYEVNDNARLWLLTMDSDGSYIITSQADSSSKVLTVNVSGSSTTGVENSLNVYISADTGGSNQRFKLILNDDNCTYRIASKCSNYTKVVSVYDARCIDKTNVIQNAYGTLMNGEWLFEPYTYSLAHGLNYAYANAKTNDGTDLLGMYPWFSGNCANFVSQCLIASGIHYQNQWYIYKKNNSASLHPIGSQIDAGWELQYLPGANTSPWLIAGQFYEYWHDRVDTVEFTGSEITSDPSIISEYGAGDVLQYKTSTIWGGYSSVAHTMLITGGSGENLLLTYHTNDNIDKNFSEFLSSGDLYIFLKFNQ